MVIWFVAAPKLLSFLLLLKVRLELLLLSVLFSIGELGVSVRAGNGAITEGMIEGCRGLRGLAGPWAALSTLQDEYFVKKLSPHFHWRSCQCSSSTDRRATYNSQHPVAHFSDWLRLTVPCSFSRWCFPETVSVFHLRSFSGVQPRSPLIRLDVVVANDHAGGRRASATQANGKEYAALIQARSVQNTPQ